MKKVLSVLLALCLLVGLVPFAASADQADSSDFTIDENGIILSYNGPGGDVVIPEGAIGFSSETDSRLVGENVDKITTLTLPASYQFSGGGYAFDYCTALEAFAVSPSNKNYKAVDGVLYHRLVGINYESWDIVRYPLGRTGPYTIPANVTRLEYNAFSDSTGLTEIDFSQCTSMGYVQGGAFTGCTGLTHVEFPAHIWVVDRIAFRDCTNLEYITFSKELRYVGESAFYNCPRLKDIYYAGTEEEWDAFINTPSMSHDYPAFPDGITVHCNSTGPNDVQPTPSPTPDPTPSPTTNPTPSPTTNPTPRPTSNPTPSPTSNPTPSPTTDPTPRPTTDPTPSPTTNPTPSPTTNPTPSPTIDPTPRPNFTDMPSNQDFVNAINWAVEKGVTTGTGGGKFSPDRSCTRAQIVTFLWRAVGKPDVPINNAFSDMPTNSDFQKAISWAAANGVTTGTGGGKFSPDQGCTRAQIVTFLWRAGGRPDVPISSSFTDMPSNSDFQKAISWAVANGITKGTGGGKFSPNAICTRAQAVTFLYRAQI